MAIKRVWIDPGCILCQLSAETCPDVFEIPEGAESAQVRPGVDFDAHADQIRTAVENCPVEVIHFEVDD